MDTFWYHRSITIIIFPLICDYCYSPRCNRCKNNHRSSNLTHFHQSCTCSLITASLTTCHRSPEVIVLFTNDNGDLTVNAIIHNRAAISNICIISQIMLIVCLNYLHSVCHLLFSDHSGAYIYYDTQIKENKIAKMHYCKHGSIWYTYIHKKINIYSHPNNRHLQRNL